MELAAFNSTGVSEAIHGRAHHHSERHVKRRQIEPRKGYTQDIAERFCYFSTDQLTDGDFAPMGRGKDEDFRAEMTAFYRGFNRSVAAFADAGNDLIVELVIESQQWGGDLKAVLQDHVVLWVWVWVPEEELQRREIGRKDRHDGTALKFAKTRDFCVCELGINTMDLELENLCKLTEAWMRLTEPGKRLFDGNCGSARAAAGLPPCGASGQ